ncbi:hypothetical protein [Bifidobacterium vansinderenii]|uniref:Holin n=1 Tax=Bifidobacterium vansinderenii TaxID=1984871 RepID=A0A229W1D4_9BIFI|nr:hypothetical protein [Bifidobacterium vansinderenii]OXN01673.1 hypothetical protein Tam10B_0115 [Bifidobacterium vansinderenii]
MSDETTDPAQNRVETHTTDLTESLPPDVQEIWYKGQRVLRTIVQIVIAFALSAPTITAIIDALGIPVDTHIGAFLASIGVATTAIAAAITRVMAIPTVNQWLVSIGLGSVPKDSLNH